MGISTQGGLTLNIDGSFAIGQPAIGGNATSVVYLDASGNIATNSGFTYNGTQVSIGGAAMVRVLNISGSGFAQILLNGTNSAQASAINFANDTGITGRIGVFGSAFATTNQRNCLYIGSDSVSTDVCIGYSTLAETARFKGNGRVGIMCDPTVGLDVLSSAGLIRFSDVATDAVNKNLRFQNRHYTAAEEDMGVVFAQASSTGNTLNFGGGTVTMNAATSITWWTAANNTTTTGTLTAAMSLARFSLFVGNFGIGTETFGSSATQTLALFNGTAPTTSPADTVQLFSADISAGNASLGIRTEQAVITEVVVSDRTLPITINGTIYKILLKV